MCLHYGQPLNDTQPRPDIVLAAINAKWIHPSFALRLLKANLGDLEHRCRIMEFALRQGEAEKVNPILAACPRILGLSVSIWNHKDTLNLLKALYEKRGLHPRVILGGPEVSRLPEDAEIFHYADYVIRGEGEEAFRELCKKLLARENKSPLPKFITPPPPDVSRILSAYDLYGPEDLKRRLIYVESSRGCVFGCDFCQSGIELSAAGTKVIGKKLREFPLEAFLTDMDRLLGRMGSGNTIKFLDRSFNSNPGRAVEILNFFLERIKRDAHKNLCVHFEMVPFRFPLELRKILSQFPFGSLRVELGIQTLNIAAASLINRAGNAEEALEILAFLREETKAIVHADLIAGLPGEDMESLGKGFDRLWNAMTSFSLDRTPSFTFGRTPSFAFGRTTSEEAGAMEIQLGILKLLPGTPMGRHTLAHAMKYAAEPPYEVIETGVIPGREMNRIKNYARFWEILVNRNHFPAQISRLLPPGEPVFWRFMELSDRLLERFGRNWGIDREELRKALH